MGVPERHRLGIKDAAQRFANQCSVSLADAKSRLKLAWAAKQLSLYGRWVHLERDEPDEFAPVDISDRKVRRDARFDWDAGVLRSVERNELVPIQFNLFVDKVELDQWTARVAQNLAAPDRGAKIGDRAAAKPIDAAPNDAAVPVDGANLQASFVAWMKSEKEKHSTYPPRDQNKEGRDGWAPWAKKHRLKRKIVREWVDKFGLSNPEGAPPRRQNNSAK